MLDIKKVPEDEWKRFTKRIFNQPEWCRMFPDKYSIWGCYKGNELIGGIIGFDFHGIFQSGGYKFTPYQGIVTRSVRDELPVAKELASFLKENYEQISIVNYDFTDIRPFLWEGYESIVKFTYIVSEINLDKDTRYSINHCKSNVIKGNIEDFNNLYQNTFKRKGLEIPTDLDWFKRFDKLIKPDIYMTDNAGAIFMSDDEMSYYIFGASEKDNNGESNLVVYRGLQEHGLTDMCGANLEEIGLYKRGFGGELKSCLGVIHV